MLLLFQISLSHNTSKWYQFLEHIAFKSGFPNIPKTAKLWPFYRTIQWYLWNSAKYFREGLVSFIKDYPSFLSPTCFTTEHIERGLNVYIYKYLVELCQQCGNLKGQVA